MRRGALLALCAGLAACSAQAPEEKPAPAPAASHAAHATAAFKTPTVTAAADGRLWRAWVAHDHVLVASSTDGGATYSDPVHVTRAPESIDSNGESRPKIVLGRGGEIFVSYTRSGKRPYTGDIRFARSVDGGASFEAPRTINDDAMETGHRFDSMTVAPDGALHIVWIDKRDLDRAEAESKAYAGAALYHAVSRDGGRTFAPNRKIKDHICECCRIAFTYDAGGALVLAWRDVMPGSIRDHAMTRIAPDGTVAAITRVTTDNWMLEGCPHHGPALAAATDGGFHFVWFTGEGPQGPGAFYARLDGNFRQVATPRRLGPAEPGTGHAAIHVDGREVFVIWKEPREGASAVMLMTSSDGGEHFSAPRELATAGPSSDHPGLVVTPRGLVLSWYAADTGHRLIPIDAPAPGPSTP